MGRSMFALQMHLDPSLSDERRYPLKLRDLIVTSVDLKVAPEHLVWAGGKQNRLDLPNPGFSGDGWYGPMKEVGTYRPYTGSIMFIDPSGRGEDETVAITGKVLNSLVYVASMYTSQRGYDEDVLEDIAKLALRDDITMIQYEDNFGDGMFGQLLRPVVRRVFARSHSSRIPTVEGIRHSTQKERRIIAALEPVLNSHRLVMNQALVDQDMGPTDAPRRLFYQLTHLTKVRGCLKHDDRLDALAGLVQYCADAGWLATDHREGMERAADEEERADYVLMMAECGISVPSDNLISRHRAFR